MFAPVVNLICCLFVSVVGSVGIVFIFTVCCVFLASSLFAGSSLDGGKVRGFVMVHPGDLASR